MGFESFSLYSLKGVRLCNTKVFVKHDVSTVKSIYHFKNTIRTMTGNRVRYMPLLKTESESDEKWRSYDRNQNKFNVEKVNYFKTGQCFFEKLMSS